MNFLSRVNDYIEDMATTKCGHLPGAVDAIQSVLSGVDIYVHHSDLKHYDIVYSMHNFTFITPSMR